MEEEYMLMINVLPGLEEAMVDCLLSCENERGFNSFQVSCHDYRSLGFSQAEQVTGRQRKIRFQIFVEKNSISALLDMLKNNFTGSGIDYWVLPVSGQGRL